MLTDKPANHEQTPTACPGVYNPVTVTMTDSIGAIFLGILAVLMLIGWRRAEGRYQKLVTQKDQIAESHSA
jgi:hypothetical protein